LLDLGALLDLVLLVLVVLEVLGLRLAFGLLALLVLVVLALVLVVLDVLGLGLEVLQLVLGLGLFELGVLVLELLDLVLLDLALLDLLDLRQLLGHLELLRHVANLASDGVDRGNVDGWDVDDRTWVARAATTWAFEARFLDLLAVLFLADRLLGIFDL